MVVHTLILMLLDIVEQNFATDPMHHAKPASAVFQHGDYMITLASLYIILATLLWQHCRRSMWDCFAPYKKMLH